MSAQPKAVPGIRTALYARVSKDSEGSGLGVARQQETCRALSIAKGWDVDDDWVLVENDTSASVAKKRPQFERLIRAMESGEVKAVIAYRLDRLVRRLDDLARLIDIARQHNVLVATVSGDLDLSTAQGRGFATLIGAVSAMEVDATAERVRERNAAARREGRLTNGGRRPYGWTVDRMRHVSKEAEVIVECAEALIGGSSLNAVCRDLNRRGITTAGGRRWDVAKLRDVLSNDRHAGRLSHGGETVTDPTGKPVKAAWPAILPGDVFDELQAALAARRVVSDLWTGERRHLLSGAISACGVCGQKLLPFLNTKGAWAYRCRGHLARNRDRVDEYVLAQVIEYAQDHPIRVHSWSREERVDLSERIEVLERRLSDLEEQFLLNGGDAARLARMTATLEAELEALRAERLDRMSEHAGAQWAEFDMSKVLARSASLLPQGTPEESSLKARAIEEQRAALRLFVGRVVIHPTALRGNGFDPSSIDVQYRDPNRLTWRAVIES